MPSWTASIVTILMSLPGFLPGLLDRLDRAEAHVVVVREEDVDVRVRLQEGLHDLLALRPGEVTGLRGDDLEVRVRP